MYQHTELFSNLSPEDITATRKACGLTEKNEYTEDEADRFRECRSLIDQGKTYDEVTELFQQNDIALTTEPQPTEPDPQLKTKNPSNANKPTANPLAISELLSLACEQVGNRISLIEAGRILEACGLPDTDEYTDSECDRFLEACDLVKKQELTYEEVAAHFGVGRTSESANLQQITEQVSLAAMSTEEGLVRLVDKVTDLQAENLPEFVQQSYLKNASRRLAESRANNDLFFAELEKRIMTRISGKSQARSLMTAWEREANLLPPSSPKPMSLPEGSDDGTNGE